MLECGIDVSPEVSHQHSFTTSACNAKELVFYMKFVLYFTLEDMHTCIRGIPMNLPAGAFIYTKKTHQRCYVYGLDLGSTALLRDTPAGQVTVPSTLQTHPSLKRLSGVGGFDQVVELHDTVGDEVVVSDGSVVEHGHLELLAVQHVHAELLVVRRRVGLLLDVGLSNLAVVHLDHDVGVERRRRLVEDDRVAQREGGRLEVQRLTDAELQVAVELHLAAGFFGASRWEKKKKTTARPA